MNLIVSIVLYYLKKKPKNLKVPNYAILLLLLITIIIMQCLLAIRVCSLSLNSLEMRKVDPLLVLPAPLSHLSTFQKKDMKKDKI